MKPNIFYVAHDGKDTFMPGSVDNPEHIDTILPIVETFPTLELLNDRLIELGYTGEWLTGNLHTSPEVSPGTVDGVMSSPLQPNSTIPVEIAEEISTPPKDSIMADSTSNLTPDSFGRGNSNGYVADIAALGAILNVKDVAAQIDRFEESIEDTVDGVGKLVTDSSFRTLEQFGLAGVQAEKLAAITNILVQKTTGELMTASVLNAKDGIIDSAKNAAAAQLQAEKIASAAVLLATQIAAHQAAKAAECCCELKEKIGADGDETRELINTIARRDADRRESALVAELSNAKQTNAIDRMLDERGGRGRGHRDDDRFEHRVTILSGVTGTPVFTTVPQV